MTAETSTRPDGRYAPSPTGILHFGNLRTALLAWLRARSEGARFIVRIEDLDPQRSRPHYIDEQLADLRALGLHWDGETVRQSERSALYEQAIDQLGDRIYPCYCTRSEIREAASAPHGPWPEGAYPGICRDLTKKQRRQKERSGRAPALRVRTDGVCVRFDDLIAGPIVLHLDDFVVRRNDGAFAYNLAVPVDDAAQGIAEVVRGGDLVETTPRQLWILEHLRLPSPSYAHIPLVLGTDGARLAKRHGAVTLRDRVALGHDAGSVRSDLAASAGLCEPGERASLDELIERFQLEKLPHEPTVLTTTGSLEPHFEPATKLSKR